MPEYDEHEIWDVGQNKCSQSKSCLKISGLAALASTAVFSGLYGIYLVFKGAP